MKNGIILIPEEVKKEIGLGKDGLVAWMKKYCPKGVAIDEAQLKIVAQIVNKYPAVSQYKKPRPNHADPFVVALANIRNLEVVTFEKSKNGSTVSPAIPDLCAEYGIECCAISDFFEKEQILFELKK